jgi:putative DNA modification/repair radical SAM protein
VNISEKLTILADAAKYDASCASSGSRGRRAARGIGSTEGMGICHSFTPDGRCVSLLKVLLTNYCIFDCHYCVNRVTSDVPRARFTVEEVVDLTLQFYRRNYIEGLFLSSGIIQSPDYTMEQLVAVARKLREEHDFAGYIHLKSIPGAAEQLVDEAGRLADRLSVNIELPTPGDLHQLAPEKKRSEIERSMNDIKLRVDEATSEQKVSRHAQRFAPAGQSTQMIVGATPTPDQAILQTASKLYRSYQLRRVYYSAYSPIQHADARLPSASPPLVREHRLYQADWLMRFYGFSADELVSSAMPNLDLHIDPKLAWALAHREHFPVDINRAPRWLLLRIPGIGSKNVDRILSARQSRRLRMTDLARLKVALRRARAFIVTADYTASGRQIDSLDLAEPLRISERQLNLFDSAAEAGSGQF